MPRPQCTAPAQLSALSTGVAAIGVAAIALWLALAAVTALLLWNTKQGDIREARLRGAATTALLKAHTANTLRAVDNALVDLERTVRRERPPRHDERLRTEMRARLASMPYVRALFVIGPDGRIQHDTDFPRTPDLSLADRPNFEQYLHAGPTEMAVSAPLVNRSVDGWFVAATRRIGDGPGFAGIVGAAIQLSYFSDLYKEMNLGQGNEILMFHRDGKLLAQYPGTFGQIGASYEKTPLFQEHLQQASSGAILAPAAAVSYPQVVNYASLPDAPLVVAQTENMKERLAVWRQWVIATSAAMLLLLAAILYGLRRYARARFERRRRDERLMQIEKMEALGQLTGSLAHDFANVLNILSTNIGLIHKIGISDARIQAALGRAQRAVDSGTAITKRLMTFGRQRNLQISFCDLNEVVSAVFPLLENAAGGQCKVVFEPGAGLHACRLDRTQLDTALINLVVNARQAIEGQGLITVRTFNVSANALHLTVDVRRQRYVCVTVRDNGKGMPEAVRRRALEPFFTTKGEEGTGLGLAQVYAFVRQLEGDLAIESEIGVGTAVHLFFPASSEAGALQSGDASEQKTTFPSLTD